MARPPERPPRAAGAEPIALGSQVGAAILLSGERPLQRLDRRAQRRDIGGLGFGQASALGATIQLTAESVENTGVHLVVLLEGRQIARRITGHLIRIDLSHFIRARLR